MIGHILVDCMESLLDASRICSDGVPGVGAGFSDPNLVHRMARMWS